MDWNYYGHFNNFNDFGFPFSSHAGPNRSDSKRQASVDSTKGDWHNPKRKRPHSFYGGAIYHDAGTFHALEDEPYNQAKRHKLLDEVDREFIRDQHPYDPIGKTLAVGTAVANRITRYFEPKTIKGQGAPSFVQEKKIDMPRGRSKTPKRNRSSSRMVVDLPTPGYGRAANITGRSSARSVAMSRNPRALRFLTKSAPPLGRRSRSVSRPPGVRSSMRYNASHAPYYGPKGRSFKKKKRRGRPQKSVKYKYNGCLYTYEEGWTAQNTQCLYNGAGASVTRIVDCAFRAVAQSIAKKMNLHIRSWDSFMLTVGRIRVVIRGQQDGLVDLAENFFDVAANTITWSQFANLIRVKCSEDPFDTGNPSDVQFYDIQVFHVETEPDYAGQFRLCQVMLDDMYLDFDYSVKLKLQNQTESDLGNPGTEVVNANPLDCKLYEVKATKFWHRNMQKQVINNVFIVNNFNGAIIKQPTADGTDTTNLPSELNKLASKSYFQSVTYTKNFKMLPGEITYFRTSRKHTMKFNRFMTAIGKLFNNIANSTSGDAKELGCSILIGAEKAMDTRNVANVPITLGFQCDQTYKCAYHYGKPPTTLSNNVVNTSEAQPLP